MAGSVYAMSAGLELDGVRIVDLNLIPGERGLKLVLVDSTHVGV